MLQADAPPSQPSEDGAQVNSRSYSLEGLPDREGLIFKSMVRLLSQRTRHAWVYVPHSTQLRVVAEGLSPAGFKALAQQVLTVGTAHAKRASYLQLPLYPEELEEELNRLGELISPPTQAGQASAEAYATHTPMRMLRWPPAAMLTTATRIRLATLMAGKPLTVSELQQRSKESLPTCAAFFDDLKRLHLLIPVISELPPTPVVPVSPLASNGPLTSKTSFVLPGLLARVRKRLGLQINTLSR